MLHEAFAEFGLSKYISTHLNPGDRFIGFGDLPSCVLSSMREIDSISQSRFAPQWTNLVLMVSVNRVVVISQLYRIRPELK